MNINHKINQKQQLRQDIVEDIVHQKIRKWKSKAGGQWVMCDDILDIAVRQFAQEAEKEACNRIIVG